jgi:hypothetical protein
MSQQRNFIHVIAFSLLGLLAMPGAAQNVKKNLPNFDIRPYHFGFMLSANQSDFNFALDSLYGDLKGISNAPQAGFNMHLMASYTLSRHVRLRFEPGLSFQDRGLSYQYAGAQTGSISRTEAVNLDIPLVLKYRTDRLNNIAAYTLLGIKYARDFQSQEDVNQQLQSGNIIRLQSGNVAADIGAGLDFFLPFFKFSIQVKTEHGLINVLIPDDTDLANPLDFLKTRSFVVSLCFEG